MTTHSVYPKKRSRLLECPTEVLSLIAEQASLQDNCFRERDDGDKLFYLRNEMRDPIQREGPYLFIKQKKFRWYGQSALALGSTCRVLRKHTLPFLFKIVTISKTTTGLFHLHIKKQHGKSFTALHFDELVAPAAKESAKAFLLHASDDLSGVRELVFEPSTSAKVWQEASLQQGSDWEYFYNEDASATEPLLKSAASTFARQITKLFLKDCTFDPSLIETVPNLEKFELVRTQEWGDVFEFGDKLAACTKLTSIILDLSPFKTVMNLSNQWSPYQWKSINTLTEIDLGIGLFTDAEWSWITVFAGCLKELYLQIFEWKVESDDVKVDFPKLEDMSFIGPVEAMPKLFNRLSATSLKEVYVFLFGEDKPESALFAMLLPSRDTLKKVEIEVLDSVPEDVQALFKTFVAQLPKAVEATFTSKSGSVWHRCAHNTYDNEDVPEAVKEAEDLRKYFMERSEQLQRVGDWAGLAEWVRWMAPLAARRMLEEQ